MEKVQLKKYIKCYKCLLLVKINVYKILICKIIDEKTIDELFNILDELCKRKELDLENGLYTALKIV